MKRTLLLLATAGTIAMSSGAAACGACVEDKVAATYDYAVIKDAIAWRRQVVFVALEGADAGRIRDRIVAAAAGVPGARRDTVRFSASPPAFSFALEGKMAPDTALAAFRRAVSGKDVRMSIVRLMRDGALVDPAT